MRQVTQSVVGHPYGECVRASYASILDLPIEEVPRFDPGHLRGQDQLLAERSWLCGIGLALVVVPVPRGSKRLNISPDTYHLMTGISPRGFHHRCVGRGGRLVWDPHPSRLGFVQLLALEFLVPLAIGR